MSDARSPGAGPAGAGWCPLLLGLMLTCAGAEAFDLQGHRGARGLAPENTLAAFRTAIAIGVDTLELDVHLSADGVPMVTHDPALHPDLVRDAHGQFLTGPGPLVRSLTQAQLQAYKLGRARPGSRVAQTFAQQQVHEGEHMPTLAAVFALMREEGSDTLRANIEIKLNPHRPDDTPPPDDIVRATLAVVQAAGMERRVTLQGFDWRALRFALTLAPDLSIACLSSQQPGFDTITDGAWTAGFSLKAAGSVPRMVKAAGATIWSPNFLDLSPDLVDEAQHLGLQVLPWTVNRPEDMARLIDWGVDGLITDYPDRARRVMQIKGMPLPTSIHPAR